MTQRANGEGGLHWDESRQRWIATVTVGYDGRGKRIVRKASGRTKTEAKTRLRELVHDREDGLTRAGYTVGDAVEDWLAYGLGRQGPSTVEKYRNLCATHIIPLLGRRKLRDLRAGRGGSLVGCSGGGVEHGQSAECARLPQPLGAPSDGARSRAPQRGRAG